MRSAYAAGLLVTALASVAAAGCSSGHGSGAADKAGGSNAPTVLRLADSDTIDQPDAPAVRYFAAQVARLSHGALRVQITFDAAGDNIARVEARTARMVQAGKFDLGLIATRAWDELGVKAFEALQAPFLITNIALLDRVVTGQIGERMIDGLRSTGFVGLALIPDQLRHPIGFAHPLASLNDFAGARVRIPPSGVTSALIRALGAIPLEIGGADVNAAIDHRRIDGEELSFGNAPTSPPSIVTANVTFFGKTLTLFAGRHSYGRLTGRQRDVLRQAAERTLQHVIATSPTENALMADFCRQGGRVSLATKRQLAVLVYASRPVYAALERDRETKRFVVAIRHLQATTPTASRPVVQEGCGRLTRPAAPAGKLRSPSILNGTYHVRFTIRDALKFGPPASNPENLHAGVETRILWNGHWRFTVGQPGEPHGTYTIKGNRITFVDSDFGPPGETFVFSLDRTGTLHLKPVLPMDRGDQWVDAGEPWQRVGPPRPIP
jgi:TRAP-type C4-dicarboxylate transport system substrate-binding protein